jgi:hypothetical protein
MINSFLEPSEGRWKVLFVLVLIKQMYAIENEPSPSTFFRRETTPTYPRCCQDVDAQ